MSGVLDRMVARTHGNLPSVEPLAKPLFQQVAAFEKSQEVVIEKEAKILPDLPQPIRLREPVATAQAPSQDVLKPIAIEKAEKQKHDVLTQPMQETIEAKKTRTTQDPMVRPHAQKNTPSRPAKRDEPAPKQVSQDNLLPEKSPVAVRRDLAKGSKTEAFQPESLKVDRDAPSITTVTPQTSAERKMPSVLGEESQAPPEIRISIGSIELQVAPREDRPRLPSFRPRISLESFLSRGRR